MSMTQVELAQRASTRYAIMIVGGDAVFLADRLLGHKIFMGPDRNATMPDFRRFVISLNRDLDDMCIEDFFAKHGLTG